MPIAFENEEQRQSFRRILDAFDAMPIQGALSDVSRFAAEVSEVRAAVESATVAADPSQEMLMSRDYHPG